MDDRRFDSLVKALAEGRNRRSVLKGLLGLGGVALVGSATLDSDAEAARRPTPTPTPIRCPGKQTPVNGVCTCPPSAPNKCGPDCCTGKVTTDYPRPPSHSECCDNACCFGTCYGEELCCPTNNRSTGEFPIPPISQICDTVNGPECCPYDDECCIVDGCCSTVCFGGSVDADRCCPPEDFCPGGDENDGICCTGSTVCCNGGTDDRACIEPATQCCGTSDCEPATEPACVVECDPETHLCTASNCLEGQICCRDDAGYGACFDGRICPCSDDDDCPDCQVCAQGTCVAGSGGEACVFFADDDDEDSGYCCAGQCLPATQVCNGGTCCPGGFCDGNGDCCPAGNVGCNGGTCCDGFCDGDGNCCAAGNYGCNGGVCCSVECDQNGNCPSDCAPNCDCSDPANDGLDCNGGLANGGGVCGCGYCVVPLDGCPCGCAGDPECVYCAGDGVCAFQNQGGSCNEGAGTCQGEWCIACNAVGVGCGVNAECCSGYCCNGVCSATACVNRGWCATCAGFMPVTSNFNRLDGVSCLDDNGQHASCLCLSGDCDSNNFCCSTDNCDVLPFCAQPN